LDVKDMNGKKIMKNPITIIKEVDITGENSGMRKTNGKKILRNSKT